MSISLKRGGGAEFYSLIFLCYYSLKPLTLKQARVSYCDKAEYFFNGLGALLVLKLVQKC